jgi:predicted ATPase
MLIDISLNITGSWASIYMISLLQHSSLPAHNAANNLLATTGQTFTVIGKELLDTDWSIHRRTAGKRSPTDIYLHTYLSYILIRR